MARMKAQPNTMVASALRLGVDKDLATAPLRRTNGDDHWQEECWRAYDVVGEFRFACDWVGSTLSKGELYATERVNGVDKRVTSGEAHDAIEELFTNSNGRTEMLRLLGIHFTVAAECVLVSWPGEIEQEWRIVAPQDIVIGSKYVHLQSEGRKLNTEEMEVLTIRMWKPHPRRPNEAMSPARSALPILRELIKLTMLLDAQLESRLAGAGILLMPSDITLPKADQPPVEEGQEVVKMSTADELMVVLQRAMTTAIQNPGTASALVPIVITAPSEAIEACRHMTFWSEMDKRAIALREEAIGRLALSMDMPPEILTGNSDANHWAAYQADEASIKSHTEPLLHVITGSLRDGYIRPAMSTGDPAELAKIGVGVDTSEMRLRPNRAKEALQMYLDGELSGDALRRETGFDEDDAPNEEQFKRWLAKKVAGGSTTPEVVEAALRYFNLDLDVRLPPMAAPAEGRPDPSLKRHPEQGPPDQDEAEKRLRRRLDQAALVAASEQAVMRALERAGNRLKNRTSVRTANVPASALYLHANVKSADLQHLLDDAWTYVPSIAERYGADPALLEATLDSYCRLALVTRAEHSFERFEEYMRGEDDD